MPKRSGGIGIPGCDASIRMDVFALPASIHLKQAPPLRAGLGPVAEAVTRPGELGLVAKYR